MSDKVEEIPTRSQKEEEKEEEDEDVSDGGQDEKKDTHVEEVPKKTARKPDRLNNLKKGRSEYLLQRYLIAENKKPKTPNQETRQKSDLEKRRDKMMKTYGWSEKDFQEKLSNQRAWMERKELLTPRDKKQPKNEPERPALKGMKELAEEDEKEEKKKTKKKSGKKRKRAKSESSQSSDQGSDQEKESLSSFSSSSEESESEKKPRKKMKTLSKKHVRLQGSHAVASNTSSSGQRTTQEGPPTAKPVTSSTGGNRVVGEDPLVALCKRHFKNSYWGV